MSSLLLGLRKPCLAIKIDPSIGKKRSLTSRKFSCDIYFSWKWVLSLNMLRAGVLSERSLNTEWAFQASRKQSPSTNSPGYELVSNEELCIQTLHDHCFIFKHGVSEGQAPVPCSSIFSALLCYSWSGLCRLHDWQRRMRLCLVSANSQ